MKGLKEQRLMPTETNEMEQNYEDAHSLKNSADGSSPLQFRACEVCARRKEYGLDGQSMG